MKPAAQTLVDLSRTSLPTAVRWLERAGFLFRGATDGGYREFRHPDGSVIWIRPNGEVVRTGPRVASTSGSGKRFRHRFNQTGQRTELHSTGELIRL